MDLADFEQKLIDKVVADISVKIEVRSYPDDYQNYIQQLKHPGGAVLVVFQGSVWDPPEPNNQLVLVQSGIYTWQFTVLQRNLKRLKNQFGIYDILEELRTILSGFTPTGFDDASILFPVDQGFLEKRQGFYVYQLTMGHTIEESEA